MRGDDQQTGHLFSYLSPEDRIPADHPLRPIRQMTDAVLARLSPRFDRLYSDIGRPSVPPEQLLRALLLQALYTVRSEWLLMEQLQYNLDLSAILADGPRRRPEGAERVARARRPPPPRMPGTRGSRA